MNIFDVFLVSNIWDIDKFLIIMSINFILITNDKTYKGLTVKITFVKRSKINYCFLALNINKISDKISSCLNWVES